MGCACCFESSSAAKVGMCGIPRVVLWHLDAYSETLENILQHVGRWGKPGNLGCFPGDEHLWMPGHVILILHTLMTARRKDEKFGVFELSHVKSFNFSHLVLW